LMNRLTDAAPGTLSSSSGRSSVAVCCNCTMTTTFLGCDGYSYTSMSYRTQAPRSSHQSSGAGALPSPPPSARSSIDITLSNRREQLTRSNSLQKTFQHLSHISAPVSPPETVAGSPPKTNPPVDITAIVTQLQPILNFRENECEITGITPACFEALQAYMIAGDKAGAWEGLR
jgi:hypothetical protein